MGKKDHQNENNKGKERVEAVVHLLRKQAPLTVKQEKFCNTACLQRFLKVKGDNVKKATKQLRTCLSWRESIGIEYLIADEFSAEISEGVAYVAGYDDESRPVLVFRIKQDYQKFHSQKLYIRLLVFTLEVAIASMAKNVDEFVLLFDASFFRSASAFMNLLLASLKVLSEYYPVRTHKAFIIDPPSLFSYLWKGVRPFVELSAIMTVVSSLEFEESMEEFEDFSSSFPRPASLHFNPQSSAKIGPSSSSSSSRFSFQVSHNFDSLKPWYLSLTDTSASIVPSSSLIMDSALISPINARSYSFASPAIARTPRGSINYRCVPPPKKKKNNNFFPLTPLPQKVSSMKDFSSSSTTPKPSFLQSPALFFKRSSDCQVISRTRESFLPFLRFYRMPYDEIYYRSKMKPPLGGLISIVSPHQLKRRHASQSQRYI